MKEKILIIDDEYDSALTIKEILENNGYLNTRIMDDAMKGFDLIEEEGNFDLIIVDVMMPIISGEEFVEKVSNSLGSSPKMMYVTIVPKQEVNISGVKGFVQKPFNPDILIGEVRRVLLDG